MDENTPIEYQIEANAGDASDSLEQVASILERMEVSLTGIASSLSTFKENSEDTGKTFKKLKTASDRAFDSERVLEFSKTLMSYQRTAQKLSKSGDVDDLAISKAMADGIKEANRLNKVLNTIDPDNSAFKEYEGSLSKQMTLLSDLNDKHLQLERTRKAAADERTQEMLDRAFAEPQKREETEYQEPAPVKLRMDPRYSPENVQREIDELTNSVGELDKRIKAISELKIQSPEELEKAIKAQERFLRAAETNKSNIVKFTAVGDMKSATKEADRLAANEAAAKAFETAINGAPQVRIKAKELSELEDVYKKIDKLQTQIANKEMMGKTAFNSPALRKMKIDLTDAEIAAVRLKRSVGELSGGKALAQNMKLVAKRTIQARIHMKLLDREAKKANRSLIQMGRVLQLMATRMAVRYVLKDLKAGFVALAQGFEPFNEVVSKLMDASTQLRNNIVSSFEPLINAIAPAATNAINAIAGAVERVAQAIAAMTGQDYYVKLTSEAQNFAKANEEAKNSLAGFDKFNLIGDSKTGSNGEKFKTEVEQLPVPENMKKWKQIGDGLKEVFKGVGYVIDSIIKKFRDWLGLAEDEDVFKAIGDGLKKAGKWIQEHADSLAKFVIALGALKVVLSGLLAVVKIKDTIKSIGTLFGIGKTAKAAAGAAGAAKAAYAAGQPGAIHQALITAGTTLKAAGTAFKAKAIAAGTTVWSKLTTAGTFVWTKLSGVGSLIATKLSSLGSTIAGGAGKLASGAASALPTVALAAGTVAAMGAVVKKGYEDVAPDVEKFGQDVKEYAKQRTGDEKNFLSSLGVLFKDKFYSMTHSGELPQYASGGILPNNGQLFIANENGPELVGKFGNQTGVLNQSGIVEAVSAGVERAVTRAMSNKESGGLNLTLKVEADTSKLFKFIVDQNNAQFNRTGRSPLKI